MYKELSLSDPETQLDTRQISSLFETAETIQINSLNRTRRKLPPREKDAQLAKLLERRDFTDNFKHALAQEVAQVIAAYDQRVRAVYFFGESAKLDTEMEEYPMSKDLTIQLLALVTSASTDLKTFVASLDRALTIVLGELPSQAFARCNSFLEVIPVNESDIEHGWGYAALFSSIYGRPLKIWQRA